MDTCRVFLIAYYYGLTLPFFVGSDLVAAVPFRKTVLHLARAKKCREKSPRPSGSPHTSRAAFCGPSLTMMKPREIYTSRYQRNGNSYVAIIPPELREKMGLVPGDLLAMNFIHGVLWCVKLKPEMIINRATVSKIFDEIFRGKDRDIATE